MAAENCLSCKSFIPDDVSKYFVFQKDFLVRERLAYKIHYLTGKDFERDDCAICSNCRMILVQIFDLEQKFVDIFTSEIPTKSDHYLPG